MDRPVEGINDIDLAKKKLTIYKANFFVLTSRLFMKVLAKS